MNLASLEEVVKFLKDNNLYAKKGLGQNFLIDKEVLNEIIITSNIKNNDTILEIGPGLGTLTEELSKRANKLISIEIDDKLIPILTNRLKHLNNFKLIHTDALSYVPEVKEYKIVANIPYYISSPLLNHYLQTENQPSSITLLVQKELAEKMCDKAKLSILSLQVQLFGYPELIRTVFSESFYPAPKVDSAIVNINTYKKDNPNYIPIETCMKILKLAKPTFTHKRKMLINTLKKQLKFDETLLLNVFKKLDIDLKTRPERLTIQNWIDLESNLSIQP